MTSLKRAFTETMEVLKRHDIEDASLEARFLIQHTLGINSSQLYSNPDLELTIRQQETLLRLVERRAGREPFAYIVERQPFYGRDYHVDSRVLIPRPETELLVALAVESARDRPVEVAVDVGTGSGIIAISLALENPCAKIYGTDVSRDALDVATVNCLRYNVQNRVTLVQGDLLEPVPGEIDMVVANLPYIAEPDIAGLMPEIRDFEPRLAICGGPDGLGPVQRLVRQAGRRIRSGGSLLLEIGCDQDGAVLALLDSCLAGAKKQVYRDPNGLNRVIKVTVAD